jgi:hypothetical protein
MVFVGNRCAKESKDTVAESLGDIPFIAMDGVHDELESRVDNGSCFFRVQAFDEGGRTFEVGKEGRDGLPFAISGTARFYRLLLGQNTVR